MPARLASDISKFGDVLSLLNQIEETYHVKVRLSVNPRPDSAYRRGAIVLATPYDPSGKRMDAVPASQGLWPSSGHKTREGLELYLLFQLVEALDQWTAKKEEELKREQFDYAPALEEYMMRRF
jgi:hypothetical protein